MTEEEAAENNSDNAYLHATHLEPEHLFPCDDKKNMMMWVATSFGF